MLVDVEGRVGGGEDLRLVDVVGTDGLENLSLDDVSDSRFSHNLMRQIESEKGLDQRRGEAVRYVRG